MKKTIAIRTALILVTVLYMGMIFMFSSEPSKESTDTSDKVVESILTVTVKDFPTLEKSEQEALIDNYSLLTRKCAHFTAFLGLGVLVSLTFFSFGIKGRRLFLLGLLVCALYAASDELHQYFVPGRACRMLDVLIDSSGAAVGLAVMQIIVRQIDRRRRHCGCLHTESSAETER